MEIFRIAVYSDEGLDYDHRIFSDKGKAISRACEIAKEPDVSLVVVERHEPNKYGFFTYTGNVKEIC